ncbi:OmpA family protein [Mangrovibacterium sp.]|uniref:OmpA family protein n=1 Tax=Mangrovibacterium sp. TaxID=1961364 RepID=UPI00356A3301
MKEKYLIGFVFMLCLSYANAQTKKVYDEVKINIENASVNTSKSDFAAAIDGTELIFNSEVKVPGEKKKETYLLYDAFSTAIQPVGRLDDKGDYQERLVTRIQEGPMSICKATGEIFVTQSYEEETDIQNIVFKKENLRLAIMVFEEENDIWKKVDQFPFASKDYSVAHPSINKTGDTIVFVSDMPGGFGGTDLYYSVRKDGKWGNPENLGRGINTSGMEMFPQWEADGTLFFASDSLGGKGGLDVFYTTLKDGKTSDILTFDNEINSNADDFGFFTGPDRRYAYFSSNRKGGKGNDDIYVVLPEEYRFNVALISTNTNKPVPEVKVNLMNSKGAVVAEGYTDVDGRLPLSLPLNEIYELTANKPGYYEKVQNIDLTPEGDLPKQEEVIYIDPSHRLKGQVVNILGNDPIEGAMLTIAGNGTAVDTTYSDAEGYFKADIQPDLDYLVTAEAENFFGTDVEFSTTGMEPGELFYYFQLYPLDIGTRIGLTNIYYDYDKYSIRPDAARELDRMAETMKKYPDLEVHFESHTDCRGTDEYNQRLSDRRAKSTFDYLIRKGISKDRMTFEGFGESQLVNECSDGVECSEELHQENRRTVFEITKSKITQTNQRK